MIRFLFPLLLIQGCTSMTATPKDPEDIVSQDIVQMPTTPEEKKTHVLYLQAQPVKNFDEALKKTVEEMYERMKTTQGIGIAAPQVGISKQIFIIEAKIEESNPRYKTLKKHPGMDIAHKQVFINPVITKVSPEKSSLWHGCLSASNHPRGEVATYKWIEFQARDEEGKEFSGRLENLPAIIFQHEFRHLLGGLYVDRAKKFLTYEEYLSKVERDEITVYSVIASPDVPLLLSDYIPGTLIHNHKLNL